MIKYIWWDFDGTIYKIPPQVEKLTNELRLKLYSEIKNRPANEEIWKEYNALYQKYKSHSMIFTSLGKTSEYWWRHRKKIDIVPFLKEDKQTSKMFREFAKLPIKHGIYTNNVLSETKKILNAIKINYMLFEHIVTIDDTEAPKPDLTSFRKIIELSKVKPEEILFVGDRLHVDVEPAKALGMKTCLVWSNEEKTAADYTFPHVADVIKIFK